MTDDPRDGAGVDRTGIEAAAFRRLVAHLQENPAVQNIDLMNLAGFCRNCLARWYGEAARERGLSLDRDQAREIIYGMPYDAWKEQHQTEAAPGAAAAWNDRHSGSGGQAAS